MIISFQKWISFSLPSLPQFNSSSIDFYESLPFLMEENPWEFNSISTHGKTFPLSSDPLFSIVITLYTLIFLYFPRLFLGVVFSPVLISTGVLLLALLRLGAIQRIEDEFNSTETEQPHNESKSEDRKWVSPKSNPGTEIEVGSDLGREPKPFYAESFVEWNVRAPLEVIYEEYEGEEGEQNDDVFIGERPIERYPSLSLYYPESDPESSSDGDFPLIGDWDSPESVCFRWDEEDREGLIEIELDGKRKIELFHFEEENLIEIDISPERNPASFDEFSFEKW
ncbi:Mucin-4 beta chain like [Actinidia chinensis var. chinensis]|uniref:Mucin-4 beta chain like n=1 Tax=Actinidia chinensis var. chinensis TaxID=1590841 RepID=A0A2R6PXS2_ACTCC|nr:Mucin-4 beta chain like [Actinidia chinensis var. chinensis]